MKTLVLIIALTITLTGCSHNSTYRVDPDHLNKIPEPERTAIKRILEDQKAKGNPI